MAKKIRLDIKIPVWYTMEFEVEDEEVVDFVNVFKNDELVETILCEKNVSQEFTHQERIVAIKPQTLSDLIDVFEFSDENIDDDDYDLSFLEYWLKIGDNDRGRIFSPKEMNDLLESKMFDELKKLETALNRDKQIDEILK